MATTTNYSWTTPDDTALVKDGAAAIRSLGTAIDSTVFTNAGAAINKSLVDAAGDLIYGTADNTVARLAIGTADQVLKVNSGATAPEWGTAPSGGMTLISTTSLTGASVTLSSIPQTYNHLQLVIRDLLPATDSGELQMRLNGDSGASRYTAVAYSTAPGTTSFGENIFRNLTSATDNAVTQNFTIIDLFDYTNTVTWKLGTSQSINVNSSTNTQFDLNNRSLIHNQTIAISSITLKMEDGNFTSGTVLLYGVK
jgi:hypothetical protein